MLTRAAPLAGGIHAAFALLFQAVGATDLVAGSLLAVALWGVIYWMLREHRNATAVVLVWIAIPLHSAYATLALGWYSGFYYYIVLMVPVMFVSPRRGPGHFALGALLAAFYLGLDAAARGAGLQAPVSPAVLEWVRGFNILCTFGVLGFLAHLYHQVISAAESRLRALATTDPLTHLANRRRILDVAHHEMVRARRDGAPFSVVLGDIDHFKRINDSDGHETGDQVLLTMATVLRTALREVDTVGRWGGEEFIVVLPDTPLDAALGVADRARHALEGASWPVGRAVTMTMGVSQWRDGETMAETVARADEALYRGKQDGRNRVVAERPKVQPNSLPSSSARR